MIEVSSVGGQTRIHGDLEGGASAYLDADWIASGGGPVAALVVAEGAISFGAGPASALPAGMDATAAAGAALLAVAREAVAALADVPGARVAVTGAGLVADRVRAAVGAGLPDGLPAPGEAAAIVETSGDPATIRAASERLATLGILVLAGESGGQRVPIDVYADVYLRGLRIVGVAPALTAPLGGPEPDLPEPVSVALGEVLPAATWYRVVDAAGRSDSG